MSRERDPYEVLEVEREASAEDVKRAYRRLALKYHPDRNPGDAEAEARFKECAAAYDVLGDPEKRRRYDQFGHAAFGQGGFGGGPRSMDDIFAAFGDIFGNTVFGDMFGRHQRGGPRGGRDLKVVLDLTLEEIDQGVERTIALKRQEHCATCEGSGARKGSGRSSCPTCGGRGQVVRNQGFFTMSSLCPRCQGQGQVIEQPCADCRGGGKVTRTEEVRIAVPAGIEEGVRLRVPAAGDVGDRGAPRGDLYCMVREVEHKIFQRSGADLITEVPVSFTQMALGDTVEVPTLRGRAEMTIPSGTQTGKVFRLRGQGLPQLDGGGRGDQLVRVFIEVPRKLGDRQKELLREFAELEQRRSGQQSFFEKIVNHFK